MKIHTNSTEQLSCSKPKHWNELASWWWHHSMHVSTSCDVYVWQSQPCCCAHLWLYWSHFSGWKEDATYFAEMFQEKVNDFDLEGRNIDVFLWMVHLMFKRQAKFCIKPFLENITFIVVSMFCPSSSTSIKSKKILYVFL